jgi:hypothetical protein
VVFLSYLKSEPQAATFRKIFLLCVRARVPYPTQTLKEKPSCRLGFSHV